MACCTCRSMVTGDASARGLIHRPSRFSSPLTLESPMRPDVLAEMPTPAGRQNRRVTGPCLHRHLIAVRRHAAQVEDKVAGTEANGETVQIDSTEHQLCVTGTESEMEIDRRRLVEAETPAVLVVAGRRALRHRERACGPVHRISDLRLQHRHVEIEVAFEEHLRARLHLEITRGHTDLDARTCRRAAFDGMVLVDDRAHRSARTAGDSPQTAPNNKAVCTRSVKRTPPQSRPPLGTRND